MEAVEGKTLIHPTALVDSSAEIGSGVEIGPYSVVGPNVRIGARTQVGSQVVIECNTTIGVDCQVMSGAILGGPPQDKKFHGEPSYVRIGDRNVIREFVTIHRASGEGEVTEVGDDNWFMAYCHIGHNCKVGSGITMANSVGISGHTVIEDKVNFGGMSGVHQKVRIGKLAMIGGLSRIVQDVPPFALFAPADGYGMRIYDLNVIGLRRNGVSAKVRADLKQAYKLLYRSSLNMTQALSAVEEELEHSEELQYLIDFIRNVRLGFGGRQLEGPRS